MTPALDKNARMPCQVVSVQPRNIITAAKTCSTATGGYLKALISFRLAGFNYPTASLAASTSGCTPLNSCSTSFFLFSITIQSLAQLAYKVSTSYFRSAFCSIETQIFYIEVDASFQAQPSFFFFSFASFESLSTAVFAS